MNVAHPQPDTLELYALGALDEIPVGELEAHLRTCAPCTEEVRRQAQLELVLAELGASATFCPGCDVVLTGARCEQCGAVAYAGEQGEYRVLEVLVQNAHGRMYLCRDRAGAPVALKELAFVQPPHPQAVEAFEREGRLLRQLSHPNIPRFLGSFCEGQGVQTRLYLAQEFVEGESLLARLGRHQFSEGEAIQVAEQVLSVIEYLQGLSPLVVHRDIKPANLIRRPDGSIALVDFGAARDLGATVGATLVGTFGYMPVEQMGGIVDATTDLYALGATLCHLLSRREPWTFLDEPDAYRRLNVSPGFADYLRRLTARRSSDRFPSAAAARAALAKVGQKPPRRARTAPLLPSGKLAMAMLASVSLFGAGMLVFLSQPPTRGAKVAITDEPDPLPAHGAVMIASGRLAIDANVEPYRIKLPPELNFPGRRYTAKATVCARRDGQVSHVQIAQGADPALRRQLTETLLRWRYHPHLVGGQPVRFCLRLQFSLEAQ